MLTFTTHLGFIKSGGDLHKAVMTVEQAKHKCMELPGCNGFTHQGGETTAPVMIWFKDQWKVYVDSDDVWTSYLIEAPLCSTTGCTRTTWNAKPADYCCRSCPRDRGTKHSPACIKKFGPKVAMPVPFAAPLPSPVCACMFHYAASQGKLKILIMALSIKSLHFFPVCCCHIR